MNTMVTNETVAEMAAEAERIFQALRDLRDRLRSEWPTDNLFIGYLSSAVLLTKVTEDHLRNEGKP